MSGENELCAKDKDSCRLGKKRQAPYRGASNKMKKEISRKGEGHWDGEGGGRMMDGRLTGAWWLSVAPRGSAGLQRFLRTLIAPCRCHYLLGL